MRLGWKDGVATACVGAASLLYVAWLPDQQIFGVSGVRPLGIAVLVLGLGASVTAVVFGVGEGLLHASRLYLVVTSVIGLVALVAGIVVLVDESESMLALLVGSTLVLWVATTLRHGLAGRRGTSGAMPRAA